MAKSFSLRDHRHSIKKAGEVFYRFFPGQKERRTIARRLANSILVANQCSPACWSATFEERYIRLNVGQVDVLSLWPRGIRYLARSTRKAKPFYRAVDVPSLAIEVDYEKVGSVPLNQWNLHEQFIGDAAAAKPNSPFKNSHSNGILDYLESLLRLSLPRPSYESRPLHILQGGVTNGDKAWLEKAARLGLRRPSWIAPSSAKPKDEAVIFISGEGFFATAKIASTTKPRPDWANRYGAAIKDIKLLRPPIPIETIRAKLPKLSWAIYPRSVHTVTPDLAIEIRRLVASSFACSEAEDISGVEQDANLSQSERETLILARRGQGQYRKQLIDLWGGGCSVTRAGPEEILKASHIKPWSACSSYEERLDRHNGLLLLPNLDALFDRVLITFDQHGRIKISKLIPRKHWIRLGLSSGMKIKLLPQHAVYLTYHRSRFDELAK